MRNPKWKVLISTESGGGGKKMKNPQTSCRHHADFHFQKIYFFFLLFFAFLFPFVSSFFGRVAPLSRPPVEMERLYNDMQKSRAVLNEGGPFPKDRPPPAKKIPSAHHIGAVLSKKSLIFVDFPGCGWFSAIFLGWCRPPSDFRWFSLTSPIFLRFSRIPFDFR